MAQFLNTDLYYDFNTTTFIMVGGMSIDDVRIKYNWFLNAEVVDAVIGEDKNGLVWYQGTWTCGTWENGTWYSGTWLNGRWKAGTWYSCNIDTKGMLEGKLHILETNIYSSKFLGGTWESGIFNYGIFGNTQPTTTIPSQVDLNFIVNNNTDYYLSGESYYYIEQYTGETDYNVYITTPIFKSGTFVNGWINASIFENGTFQSGFINNSIWKNGTFNSGIFLGDYWYNGSFYGGDFSNGIWQTGTFTISNSNVSRFGTNYKNNGATWLNGTFNSGEFYSGLNTGGTSLTSLDHSLVNWENGTFINGKWYGGTFKSGTWETGIFYEGIIFDIIWKRGNIYNCLWKGGTFYDGTIKGGIYDNINIINADLGYNN